MKLKNNPLALVTGASAGIGAASARALHAAGAQVLLAARRTDRLQALAEELPGSETVQLDVRDASAVQKALQDRAIDIAVLNAGLARGAGPIQEGDPADWDEMLDTNVKGVLHCARAVLPGMLDRKRGDMVLLGSVAGRQVYPGGNVYNASKFAVHALYQALRLDAGGRGVRFTTLDPGMVQTEFAEVRYQQVVGVTKTKPRRCTTACNPWPRRTWRMPWSMQSHARPTSTWARSCFGPPARAAHGTWPAPSALELQH